MKAIVYNQYGTPDVLQLQEFEKPIPRDNEVLIKVYAASINSFDWRLLTATPFLVRLMGGGMFTPKNKILGADFAGRIEAVGRNVTHLQVGDEVFGDLAMQGCGGYAEYVCAQPKSVALKSASMSFEEAASLPMAAITALQGLRDFGCIQSGQRVLINGASGGVGMFAVQIAKAFGAEVTAVCSTRNLAMVKSLGADHIIDYTKEDFTKNGHQYDLVMGANGYHSIWEYKRALKPKGIYVMTGGTMSQMFQAMLLGPIVSMIGSKKMCGLTANANSKDLTFIKTLFEAGKIKPVIDRVYKLSDTPDVFRYFEDKHAQGKLVISVVPSDEN